MKNDYDAPEGEAFDEIYQSDGLRWMSVIIVLLVIFGFFSLAWYAWRNNTQSVDTGGELIVVEADTAPYKEQPDEPGGMEFPHQDKEVYNRLVADGEAGEEQVERLLPEAEQPLKKRVVAAEAEGKTASWINKKIHPSGTDDTTVEVIEAAEKEAQQEPVETAKAEAVQEEREKTERRDEVKSQSEIPAYVPPKPVVKPWLPKEEPKKEVETVSKKPVADEDPIVQQAENYVKKAAQVPPAVKKEPAASAVEVQLAALRSRAEAETVWKRLSVRHKDLLAGRSHRIMEANIPGKGTYYRLRVGAASAADGKSLCSRFSQRKQACILAK